MTILCPVLGAYEIVLLVRVFSSWFRIPSSGPMRRVMDAVYAVTEPVLRPLRGILPPLRLGMAALDLSPIIVFVVIGVIQTSLGCGFIV